MQYKSIPRMQTPRTVYIIGGGPSLKDNNPDDYLTRDDCVLATNDAYQYQCASACLFADGSWWRLHRKNLEEWDGVIWTTSKISHPRVQCIQMQRNGLSTNSTWIGWNMCTGWAGLNIALLAGAKKVVLLGFDMSFGTNGDPNWHRNIRRLRPSAFNCFLSRQHDLKSQISRRFNCPIVVAEPTALTAWKTMPFAEAVAWGRT